MKKKRSIQLSGVIVDVQQITAAEQHQASAEQHQASAEQRAYTAQIICRMSPEALPASLVNEFIRDLTFAEAEDFRLLVVTAGADLLEVIRAITESRRKSHGVVRGC